MGVRASNVNQLISQASEVVPTTQETLNDIRKSMQRIEKMTPLVEDTFREYRDLGRSLNNSVPDLRRTNDDVDKLVRAAQDAVPQVTRNADQITRDADDAAAASRAIQKVAERTDLLLRQNQDKITQAISNLNDVLSRHILPAERGEHAQRDDHHPQHRRRPASRSRASPATPTRR